MKVPVPGFEVDIPVRPMKVWGSVGSGSAPGMKRVLKFMGFGVLGFGME